MQAAATTLPHRAGLADDLHRCAEGRPIAARPVNVLVRLANGVKRRPAVAVLLLLGALAACGAAVAGYQAGYHERSFDETYHKQPRNPPQFR